MTGAAAPAPMRRDALTLLGYSTLGAYAFWLYALGPALTLLRHQLHLSYSLTSLHSTLWAGGAVLVGLLFDGAVRRRGRMNVLWMAALCGSAGALLMAGGQAVGVTLLAAALLGTFGTTVQTASSGLLAEHQRGARDQALLEANIGASVAAVMAPLVIGALERAGVDGRVAMALPVLTLAAAYLFARRRALRIDTPAEPVRARPRGDLPPLYWRACWLVAVAVAIEFCIVFYAPALLERTVGVAAVGGATLLGVFYLGELIGRVAGSRLTRVAGAPTLIGAALALAGVALCGLWVSGVEVVSLVLLLVAGVGVGNLYPLSVAMAVAVSGSHTDQALGHTQLLAGASIAGAPLLLGALSDAAGVRTGFVVEPLLVLAAIVLWRTLR